MGRTLSETHRANISAGGMGRIMSAETRAKIGDTNRGKVRSLEVRQEMSRSRTGHRRHTADSKAKISAALLGKPKGVRRRPPPKTDATRAKLSAAFKGKKPHPNTIEAVRIASTGRKHSTATRAQMSAAHKGKQVSELTRSRQSARAKTNFVNGRTNLPPKTRYTKLAQRLHRYLEDVCDIIGLRIEERFGPYQVDLFDPATRTAFEADGSYWHELREGKSPGCHARRDTYLKDAHGITVVHFTDVEIKALTSKVAA